MKLYTSTCMLHQLFSRFNTKVKWIKFDFSTIDNPVLGVSGVLFHFYFIFDRNSCQQTVQTPIRCPILLIWVKQEIQVLRYFESTKLI